MSDFGSVVTFIYTDDMTEARRLWEQTLGLPCVIEQTACRIYRVAPGGYVGVCTLADRPKAAVGVTITLVTRNVDAACQRLADAGYRFERAPAYLPEFDITSALFLTAEGYRVEIQEFRSHPELGAPAGEP